MPLKPYLRRLEHCLALDARSTEALALLVPAYLLAVALLLTTVVVHYGFSLADALNCASIHNCARLVPPAIVDLVSFFVERTFSLFDSDAAVRTEYATESWKNAKPVVGDFLIRLVLLSPLVPFVVAAARNVATAVFFLFAFVLISSGWGALQPILMTDVLALVRRDQFLPFWEFGRIQLLIPHDMYALAFLLVLALFLAGRQPTPLRAAAFAAFGQISYEHLGFITGVAAFFHILLTAPGTIRERVYPALRVLVACGIASVAVVALMGLIILTRNIQDSHAASSTAFFAPDLFRFAKSNITNYRYILFRGAYFLFFPAAFGLVSGLAAGFISPLNDEWRRRYRTLAAALLAILAGYFGALTIGFFTVITYSSEMARELYPFVILLFFLAFALGAMGGSAGRRRTASPA